jgi:uncharacterized protein (TIGR02452 family)
MRRPRAGRRSCPLARGLAGAAGADNRGVTNRDRLRLIARETVRIAGQGSYRLPAGSEVGLGEQVARAVAGTRLYEPGDQIPAAAPAETGLITEVTNETTLAAARRLGDGVACLVFASARNPGGGFLNGAQAQEESLARASALYACLSTVPQFYAFHRQEHDLRYSDRVIYCPAVPVFRDDSGALLAEPHLVSFLTSAAPNLGAIRVNQPAAAGSVPGILRGRAARVLRIAAGHGHRKLVLGAWGCGVFGNDPAVVAGIFADLLREEGRWFGRVVFAVYDRRPGAPDHAAFARVFG